MPSNREYQQLPKRRAKRCRRQKVNWLQCFVLGLIVFSVWIAWKDNSQNQFSPSSSQPLEINSDRETRDNVANIFQNSQPDKIGSTSFIQNYDYTYIDRQAVSTKYQGNSVTELASLLSQSARTDIEKARIIYTWLANNIIYNVPALLMDNYGDQSPEGVLRSRQAVCSGYANLYQALAQKMGLEAAIIEGYAKGLSYAIGDKSEINHAWNGVKLNDGWYLVDATWGAGQVQENAFIHDFNPYYFATPPEQFIYNHLSGDRAWQLLTNPITKQQFDHFPEISPEFFKTGLQLVSHPTHIIQANGRVEIVLQAPKDTIASVRLSINSQNLADTYQLINRKNENLIVSAAFPSSGNYKLEIFAKKKSQQIQHYSHVITYQIQSEGAGEEFPLTYATFTEHEVSLNTPLVKALPSQQEVYFELLVPEASDIQVVDETSHQWTPLTHEGSLFKGYAVVSQGTILVIAKFPENSQYWTIVEYQGV